MGKVHCRIGVVLAVPLLGEELVGTAGGPVHLRCLYHQENKMAVVERERRPREVRHVVDRRTGVRPSSRLFHQFVLLPELRHPLQLAREVAAQRRLSVCEQAELRTAHTADPAHHAAHTAHAAHLRLQELYLMAPLGLPPCAGTGHRAAERHRGVQLSCRRYHLQQCAIPDRILPAGVRQR